MAAFCVTPFRSPPGLEVARDGTSAVACSTPFEDAVNEVKASVLVRIEQKIKAAGSGGLMDKEAMQNIREAVMADVDSKMSEKADELWRRGQRALVKMEDKHRDKSSKVLEEVARMKERQASLKAENEKLKPVMHALHARFLVLSSVFGGKGITALPGMSDTHVFAATTAAADAAAAASCPRVGSVPTDVATATPSAGMPSPVPTADVCDTSAYTPHTPTSVQEAASVDTSNRLPDVPPFPFVPNQAGHPTSAAVSANATPNATPFSLTEALGTQTPQRTPLSLFNSLTPMMGTPEARKNFLEVISTPRGNVGSFSFTIRKADGADLGLNVSHHEHDPVLRVDAVRPEGAVGAWNRQCNDGGSKHKAVLPGDRILQVNSIAYDPTKMLEECRDKLLLRLTVQRDMFPAAIKTPTPTIPVLTSASQSQAEAVLKGPPAQLRADASFFARKSHSDHENRNRFMP